MKKRSLKLLSVAGFIAGLAMIFASCGKDNVPELIVEDPVITVSEADENGKVSVALSCKTAGAQIFYSTDGSDPSTEYSAPITLTPGAEEKTYTVKAQAKKSGYTASKIVQESVTVAAAEEEIVTFTVTFESDGGTAVDPVTAADGTPIAEPTAPTKTGYTFAGWYNGETKYDFISNVTSDLTLTAKWTINTYTVTFDTDGGSAIESVTVDYNTAAAQPATNPTKTGYTFAGWKVGETTYDFATLVTADTTVKAVWTINTYTITFDSDGGSAVESITVNYNTTATQPEEPTKDGEYFAGWVDAEGNVFQFTTPITADITLKATWTTDPVYTVTIDPNYEGASTTSIYATKDTEYKVTLSAPSREGYTFAGWTTDAAGTTAADFTVAISNNTTIFYAQWETATFTVTFDVDGTTTPVTVNYGETIAASDIPTTTKTGYTFAGWKNGETTVDVTTAITSSVTLTATWTINTYTVTLNIDGTTSKLAENVEHGTPVAAPATTPTKTGYTFAGWKLGEADYNFATPVTADITLTASWTINTYTITFNTDGGSAVDNVTVNYNTTVTQPEDPTKDGYVFRGWVRGETTYNFSTPVTSDITLTAVWYEPQTYTYTVENNSIFITKNNDAEVDDEYQAKITNVIPDTDRFEIGDKISITLKGYSKSSIDELVISIVDNTAAANYWLVLANPDNVEIEANTQFEHTVELTVKAKAIGTGAASQTIVLTYNGDEGAVIYKDAATMAALTPKSYTYTIPATATEPIVFISDDDSKNVDDDYKAVLTNTIPTLKAGDTVTLKISGASTIDIGNLSAMIFDNTREAGWYKVLSSTENFSAITAKTDFSELSVTLSITDDPVGTGADSQKIMLKYNGSGAAKIYDSAENIPDDLPPADDPTGDEDGVTYNTARQEYSIRLEKAISRNNVGYTMECESPVLIKGLKIKTTIENEEPVITEIGDVNLIHHDWDSEDVAPNDRKLLELREGEVLPIGTVIKVQVLEAQLPNQNIVGKVRFYLQGNGIENDYDPRSNKFDPFADSLTPSENKITTPIDLGAGWEQHNALKFKELSGGDDGVDAKKIVVTTSPNTLPDRADIYASLKIVTWLQNDSGEYVETPVSGTGSIAAGPDGAYSIDRTDNFEFTLTLDETGTNSCRWGDVQFYGYGLEIKSIVYYY